jgi:hypothetical protein
MNMNDDMDDLDRALFALPLATPPDGLRAALFDATVFAAPRAVVAVAKPWELWAVGAALAVAAWLCAMLVAYKGFAAAFTTQIDLAIRAFTEPTTLAWLSAGLLLSALYWYVSDRNFRLPLRGARS